MVLQKGKHMIVMELIRISNILNSNISGVILGRKYLNFMSNDYQFYVSRYFSKRYRNILWMVPFKITKLAPDRVKKKLKP